MSALACCSTPQRRRWQLLRDAVKTKTVPVTRNGNNRSSLDTNRFITSTVTNAPVGADGIACNTENSCNFSSRTVRTCSILQRQRQYTNNEEARKEFFSTLTGFDNTGNLCVWVSELVMTYTLLKHWDKLILPKDHNAASLAVCELAAGATGLASLFLAANGKCRRIIASDGNDHAVSMLNVNILQNSLQNVMEARRIRFECVQDIDQELLHSFDLIIAADCLFYDKIHRDMLRCISDLLKTDGVDAKAILFAPPRGCTVTAFCSAAALCGFHVAVHEQWDDVVDDVFCSGSSAAVEAVSISDEQSNANYCKPLMLTLTKLKKTDAG